MRTKNQKQASNIESLLLTCILAAQWGGQAYSQAQGSLGRAPQQRIVHIDPLSLTSLLLTTLAGDQAVGEATGFVVKKGPNDYLITNLHVLIDRDFYGENNPSGHRHRDHVRILHNAKDRLGEWIPIIEPLYDGPQMKHERWVEYSYRGKQVDLVALPLSKLENVAIYALDLGLKDTSIFIGPADQVSIVGFPGGLPSSGGLPIWKSGTIASDPEVDIGDSPVFLVDATTRPGMSGSPVYARRYGSFLNLDKEPMVVQGWRDRLLGVYSAQHKEEEMRLGLVWKADVLVELYNTLP